MHARRSSCCTASPQTGRSWEPVRDGSRHATAPSRPTCAATAQFAGAAPASLRRLRRRPPRARRDAPFTLVRLLDGRPHRAARRARGGRARRAPRARRREPRASPTPAERAAAPRGRRRARRPDRGDGDRGVRARVGGAAAVRRRRRAGSPRRRDADRRRNTRAGPRRRAARARHRRDGAAVGAAGGARDARRPRRRASATRSSARSPSGWPSALPDARLAVVAAAPATPRTSSSRTRSPSCSDRGAPALRRRGPGRPGTAIAPSRGASSAVEPLEEPERPRARRPDGRVAAQRRGAVQRRRRCPSGPSNVEAT